MNNIRLYILLLLLGFSTYSYSQIEQEGIPLRFHRSLKKAVNVIEMPPFDSLETKKETDSIQQSGKNKKCFFAKNYKVYISPDNSGIWETVPGNTNCWTVKINSKSARAIGLVFVNFKLKKDEKLFIYNKNEIIGAFTEANNLPSLIFPVRPIKGDEATIEFTTPYNKNNKGTFVLNTVAHVYRDFLTDPGACNININCSEGDNWQNEKRAVCKLLIYPILSDSCSTSYSSLCSGALINNSAFDQKPLILTAHHCLYQDNCRLPEGTVFYFNYESQVCYGSSGIQNQALAGSKQKSTIYANDFTLLELYSHPPMSFKPYYAGWSTDTTDNLDTVTAIHHPQGSIKKISISNSHPITDTYEEPGWPAYATNGFWRVKEWNKGVTEEGSSGSPLFDKNHRIVGSLTGGEAACGYPYNDYFEKLTVSFNSNPDTLKQLKYWLDPLNSDVTNLDGYDPFNFNFKGCDTISNILDSESIEIIPYDKGNGYYSGHNSDSISIYAERFQADDSIYLSGTLFNINRVGNIGKLSIRVYKGSSFPEDLIFENTIPYSSLNSNKMNYFEFYPYLKVKGTYFIGYGITYLATDTFNMYQAVPRNPVNINTAYLYVNNSWIAMNNYTSGGWGTSFDISALICKTSSTEIKPVYVVNQLNVYPNPVYNNIINVKIPFNSKNLKSFEITDIAGRYYNVSLWQVKGESNAESLVLDLKNILPGFYVIKLSTETGLYISKFIKAR